VERLIFLKIDPTFDEWGTKLTFSLVYPDKRGKNVMKEIGVLDAHKSGRDDHRTLDDLHFQLGDLIAISTFNRDSANANATSGSNEMGN
jgi:histone deacetylase complex subunit SAP18